MTIFQRPVTLTDSQIEEVLLMCGANWTKRQGENIQADHCMIHHNGSPTLGVSLQFPFAWNCFSCGAKGPNIVTLVEKALKKTNQEAYSILVQKFGLSEGSAAFDFRSQDPPPRQRFELSESVFAAYPLDQDNNIGYRAAKYYLGIDKPDADRFRLGYRRKDHRLVFPVFHADGVLGGLIGRSMLPGCRKEDRWMNFDSGQFKKAFVLMGAELPVDTSKPLIAVEGPKDYCKIRSFGWDNVRATLGTEFSDWQLQTLIDYQVPILPLYDDDKGGRAGTLRLIRGLKGRVPIMSATYPEGCHDESGKGDPGLLTPVMFRELLQSMRASIKFAFGKT